MSLHLFQFLVYFIYFIVLTVVYFIGAAVGIFRHCRSQAAGEGVSGPQAQPEELHPVVAGPQGETLSNGTGAKA